MRMTVLAENTSLRGELEHVHGLSVLIESAGRGILFDAGPGGEFLRNAERLGEDLRCVDALFLSHGHRDHGGGLEEFLELNDAATVYAAPGAFEGHWAMRGGRARDIGLDAALKERYPGRIVFAEAEGGGLKALRGVTGSRLFPEMNANLMKTGGDGGLEPDDFAHEQSLLLTEGRLSVLFAGCAHRGILNIMDAAVRHMGRAPNIVIAGFHLHSEGSGADEPRERVMALGAELAKYPSLYITGHCTGSTPFAELKETLGERLVPMSVGSVFEF